MIVEALVILTLVILLCMAIFMITYDTNQEHVCDLPSWFTTDPEIRKYYFNKVKNLQDNFSYGMFFYKNLNVYHLGQKNITWKHMEKMMKHIKVDEQFDIVIGILSGGGFIAEYVRRLHNVPKIGYIKVKNYSDNSYSEQLTHALYGIESSDVECEYGCDVKYLSLTYEKDVDVKGKRVLLVDDTISTGLTIKYAKTLMYDRGAQSVKTYSLFSNARKYTDYYYRCPSRIPVYWPWGFESN